MKSVSSKVRETVSRLFFKYPFVDLLRIMVVVTLYHRPESREPMERIAFHYKHDVAVIIVWRRSYNRNGRLRFPNLLADIPLYKFFHNLCF